MNGIVVILHLVFGICLESPFSDMINTIWECGGARIMVDTIDPEPAHDTAPINPSRVSEQVSSFANNPSSVLHTVSKVLLGLGALWLVMMLVFLDQVVWVSRLLCYSSWISVVLLAVIFFGSLADHDRQTWVNGLVLVSSVSPDNAPLDRLLTDWLLLYGGPILFCVNCLISAFLHMDIPFSGKDRTSAKELNICFRTKITAPHNTRRICLHK